MSSDHAEPRKTLPGVDLSQLPNVLSVRSESRRFDVPRLFVEHGKNVHVSDVIEVIIETDEPFVKRALSPVLFVGGVALTESRRIDDHHYAFYGPHSERLANGAAVSLSWTREGESVDTGHRFQRPQPEP